MAVKQCQPKASFVGAACSMRQPQGLGRELVRAYDAQASIAMRNIRAMHLVARIAKQCRQANIPLMMLKGAALQTLLYRRPDERPMDDIDLMIRPQDIDRVRCILEQMGALRRGHEVREDFFPRFHYETEYTMGSLCVTKIDLHVRPFRPLPYAVSVPPDALWRDARETTVGQVPILVPSATDMLLHLLVHAAIHGAPRGKWLDDISRWVGSNILAIDFDELADKARAWRLVAAIQLALGWLAQPQRELFPGTFLQSIAQSSTCLRDRVILAQAPRDATHPVSHVLVNLLATRSAAFRLAYAKAILLPNRAYMGDWYSGRHAGWLPLAHWLRWLSPLFALVPGLRSVRQSIEIRPSPIHGVGVFAVKPIGTGEVIARCAGKRVRRQGTYVVRLGDSGKKDELFELTGHLKYLNHSCRPNAKLHGLSLVALGPIAQNDEIQINYGIPCRCHETQVVAAPAAHAEVRWT